MKSQSNISTSLFQDRLDLQDALKSCDWKVDLAIQKIRSDMQSLNQAGQKKKFLPKKNSKIILYFHKATTFRLRSVTNLWYNNKNVQSFNFIPFFILGIKAHDESTIDMSDSEEDEYNNTGIVYDSENSDEDFDSEDEELVRTTTLSYQ